MNQMQKINRIHNLVDLLNVYCDAYYNNIPMVEDKEYDDLFDELQTLENETHFILSSSPTQRPGYPVSDKLPKTRHKIPLLSLAKTKSVEEAVKFVNGREVVFSIKCDGLTCKLTYDNGQLVEASTRGDGETGSVITNNAKTFTNVPLTIPYKEHLEVVGEALVKENELQRINTQLLNGEKPYTNVRNLASGSVQLLDPKICAQRHIYLYIFNTLDGLNYENKTEQYEALSEMGFTIVPNLVVNPLEITDSLENTINYCIDTLKGIARAEHIPCDGIVERYNDVAYSRSLGKTSHHYLDGIAIKDFDEGYETILKDIEWNVSRQGIVVPTAIFDEVDIDGAKISRCSLNNVDFIRGLELGIGDHVIVSRRNMVIPYCEDNLTRSGTYKLPTKCPSCGEEIKVACPDNTNILICSNPCCPSRILSRFEHAFSKKGFNIDGMSEATIETFYNAGFLKTLKDVFYLKNYEKNIVNMNNFGAKSYQNLCKSTENARHIRLENYLYALGIPQLGMSACKTISNAFNGSWDNFMQACKNHYAFSSLSDFGETTEQSIYEWYNKEDSFEPRDLASEFIFDVSSKAVPVCENNIFNGKTFVITGTFEMGSRENIVEKIEFLGAKNISSVSKKADFLLVGEKAGSKLEKAQALGVRCIDEKELTEILKNNG